jgi:hypothetical protein
MQLLVLSSIDATYLGHWQTAPLPVLLNTMRMKRDDTIRYFASNATKKILLVVNTTSYPYILYTL